MADEQEHNVSPTPTDNPTPIDPANPPAPIREQQAKTIREIRAETVAPAALPDAARELRAGESAAATSARHDFEDAMNKPVEAIEDAINTLDAETTPQTPDDVLAHDPGNTTNFFGLFTINMPIYDVVFISLFIFTIIEVAVGEIFQANITAPVIFFLLAMAFVKAFHVIWFYMHLGTDNRIFWATLMLPFFIALVSTLYLLAVPTQGY